MAKEKNIEWSNIGKASFRDFAGFREWYMTQGLEWAKENWSHHFYRMQTALEGSRICSAFHKIFNFGPGGFPSRERNAECVLRESEYNFKKIQKFEDYLSSHDLCWDVKYISENPSYAVIAYGTKEENRFVIPNYEQWLEYTPYVDYSSLPLNMIKQLVGAPASDGAAGSTQLATSGGLVHRSVRDVRSDISSKKEALSALQNKMKDVEEAKTGELAELRKQIEELQAQMEIKKELLLAELDAKRAELALQQEKLEMDLFILESEIYSIRCFLGETIEFLRVRKGENAPLEVPVVLYQKTRFLDEDLGKFSMMFGEKLGNNFEDALAVSDNLVNMVLPNVKCVSLIRVSKDGRVYDHHSEWANMLEEYEVLHGHQLALLVRNGDNVYVGWTEEDRVRLGSEDFFLTPTTSAPVENEGLERRPYETDEDLERRMKQENKRHFREFVSRYFLFSILNGLSADENSILPLPKFNSPEERSRHILYSMADNWLSDNRFGNFNDIIARCNARMTRGDYLLTVQGLSPHRTYGSYGFGYHRYENVRGIGDANRTHDVCARDCEIYPLNLIVEDPPREMIHYTDANGIDHGWTIEAHRGGSLCEGCKVLERYSVSEEHYYISLEKRYSPCDARANFEVFPEEVINLTYMNSVWLNYILSSKNVMGWVVGGEAVNYAYALKYIAKALEHIKGRETMEKARIDAVTCDESITSDPDWPVHLSEWKLSHNVRQISDYQAKRFVKYMNDPERRPETR